jgi:hypothetical protein
MQEVIRSDSRLSPVVRALLERERVVVPVPAEIRNRALARARECLLSSLLGTLSGGRVVSD